MPLPFLAETGTISTVLAPIDGLQSLLDELPLDVIRLRVGLVHLSTAMMIGKRAAFTCAIASLV